MMSSRKDNVIIETAEELLQHKCNNGNMISGTISPSVSVLTKAVELISEVIFPEYLLKCSEDIIHHRVIINLESIYLLMHDQIGRAIKFKCADDNVSDSVDKITTEFISSITEIKALLLTDVEAIYKADPAAKSFTEIVLCYPSIIAITHHRIAHSLYKLGVPIIPRVISELAHSKCGIDIHPGATIGSYFAIDHGTGVVIGETTIIGKNVVIYQGVTLGARGFRFDENGNAINVPRHPIIEDNVRIYSNSSILGRITIGENSIIGGNMWIDKDIEPNSSIVKRC